MAVVVDSAASLPATPRTDVLGHKGPIVVPMAVILGGRTYRDGVDLSASELYERLAAGSGTPTTSAPAPEAYAEAFLAASRVADAALCITVSRTFSAALDSATLAAARLHEEMPGFPVSVLDSGSAAGGEGLIVLAAQESAASGADLAGVVAAANSAASQVRLVAYVDTLYYLWKGGRVPGIVHEMTSLLKLKPVFEMAEGRVNRKLPSRTSRRARRRLVDMVGRGAGGPVRACVMHAAAATEAAELEAALRDAVDCEDVYVAEFSPVMGAHTGPGMLGIAYLPV